MGLSVSQGHFGGRIQEHGLIRGHGLYPNTKIVLLESITGLWTLGTQRTIMVRPKAHELGQRSFAMFELGLGLCASMGLYMGFYGNAAIGF